MSFFGKYLPAFLSEVVLHNCVSQSQDLELNRPCIHSYNYNNYLHPWTHFPRAEQNPDQLGKLLARWKPPELKFNRLIGAWGYRCLEQSEQEGADNTH